VIGVVEAFRRDAGPGAHRAAASKARIAGRTTDRRGGPPNRAHRWRRGWAGLPRDWLMMPTDVLVTG